MAFFAKSQNILDEIGWGNNLQFLDFAKK